MSMNTLEPSDSKISKLKRIQLEYAVFIDSPGSPCLIIASLPKKLRDCSARYDSSTHQRHITWPKALSV